MQIAVMSYARNVLGYADANSSEFDPDSTHPVIDLMESQQGISKKGGTMRLGAYPCKIRPNTIMASAYGEEMISERHRHRYEFNNDFRQEMQDAGLVISGTSRTAVWWRRWSCPAAPSIWVPSSTRSSRAVPTAHIPCSRASSRRRSSSAPVPSAA